LSSVALSAPAQPGERGGLTSFLAALTISKVGDALYLFTLPWIAYELTGSAVVMGTLYAAEVIPVVLFGAFAGVVVDRYGVQAAMIASDLARAILVAAIPLLNTFGLLHLPHLYAIAFGLGMLTVLFDVATTAAIPRLTSQHLTRANSVHQSTTQLAAVTGPALAGLLIQAVGAYGVMTIDAASFAATLVVVMRQPLLAAIDDRPRPPLLGELGEGARWMWRSGAIRTLALQAAIGNFGFAMVSAVMLFYLRDTLHAPASIAGATFAMLGAGGVIGSLAIVPLERRFRKGVLYPAILTMGFIGLGILAAIPSAWGVAFGLTLLAACNMSWVVLSTSVRQERIPKPLLGRILAISRVFSMASMPLGAAAGGWIAAGGSVRTVFLLAAVTKLVEITIARRREIREL
jgi:MFS family permease